MDLTDFGRMPDGRPVHEIRLGADPGPVVHLITLGASVHRLEVTCGDGRRRNVALGHATVADRLASSDYLGSTVGRYANRIAGGRVRLGDVDVRLATNDRGNSLHGGTDGFDRRLWDLVDAGRDHAHLRLVSPDGDMGFPGTVTADVHYLVEGETVRVRLEATTDETTLVNLTNHAYFNLDGEDSGTIDRHRLTLHADEYTPVDADAIPTGRHEPVDGTPFDFRTPTTIGPAVRRRTAQVELARGIDHNYVLRGRGLRTAAVLESPGTGTRLALSTDQPGLQVYTGNFLDGSRPSISGGLYRQGDGIALEPQLFPDTPHHPEWPSAVLEPGDTNGPRVIRPASSETTRWGSERPPPGVALGRPRAGRAIRRHARVVVRPCPRQPLACGPARPTRPGALLGQGLRRPSGSRVESGAPGSLVGSRW